MAAASFHDVVQAATAGHVGRLGELLDVLPALPYLRWDCRIYGFAPLMEAAYHNQADAAALLLDRGFRINDLDASGQSALMHAALAGRAGVVKLLLARGACTHFRNVDGMSAAMCAAANGHIGALAVLLAHEEKEDKETALSFPNTPTTPTSPSSDGKTRGSLLHLAAGFGRAGVVGYLLSRGADEAALDSEGRSALECAREWAHWSCVAVLEDAVRARVLRRARRLVDAAAITAGEGAEVLSAVEVDGTGLAGAVAALVVEDLPTELFIELVSHFPGPPPTGRV